MYQALYRKWRPRAFADVIGQEHITSTLRREVAEDRTSHAYLFTGTRGTGKTTCAKILAKAVNCEHPEGGDPCNRCPSCLGIDSGSFTDVLELDAASNNGVDQVRALRDEAVYAPANVRRRVYIIDEVHMLSVAAFNALLKILEEPPAHLVFILATTELQKVPVTVLSRCQRFAFRRITAEDIAGRLLYVAREEGISLTDDAARLLADRSDGALRDALSLLDQCAAGGGAVDTARIAAVLGFSERADTEELMRLLLSRDTAGALTKFDSLYAAGKDATAVLSELTTLVRDLLIRATAPKGGDTLYGGGYGTETLDRLLHSVSPARLMTMATVLQEFSYSALRGGNRRLAAELCLLTLADERCGRDVNTLFARVDRLEAALQGGAVIAPAPAAKTSSAEKLSPPPPTKKPAPAGEASAPEAEERPPFRETPPPPADLPPWETAPAGVAPSPTGEAPTGEAPAGEAPPPAGEVTTPADAPASGETPPPAPAPAEGEKASSGDGDTELWQLLLEQYKSRMLPMNRAFLDHCSGLYRDGVLTVFCDNEATRALLSSEATEGVLREVTEAHTGTPVRVRVAVGSATENHRGTMDDLIRLGKQFEGFTIK